MLASKTVAVHTYSAGPDNGYGETAVYTPSLGSAGVPADVYGWAIAKSTEPPAGQGNVVVTDAVLYAPPDFDVSPLDVIDLDDGQYHVMGNPEDHTNGPFGTALGVVVNLRRVDG